MEYYTAIIKAGNIYYDYNPNNIKKMEKEGREYELVSNRLSKFSFKDTTVHSSSTGGYLNFNVINEDGIEMKAKVDLYDLNKLFHGELMNQGDLINGKVWYPCENLGVTAERQDLILDYRFEKSTRQVEAHKREIAKKAAPVTIPDLGQILQHTYGYTAYLGKYFLPKPKVNTNETGKAGTVYLFINKYGTLEFRTKAELKELKVPVSTPPKFDIPAEKALELLKAGAWPFAEELYRVKRSVGSLDLARAKCASLLPTSKAEVLDSDYKSPLHRDSYGQTLTPPIRGDLQRFDESRI